MQGTGVPPNKWPVELEAEVGASEEFVKHMLEIPPLVDAGDIFEPQRHQAKEAIYVILMDGLIPAFLELRQIREPVGQTMPLMNRRQLYEDFARKLWKAYKQLTQDAAGQIGFNIGFLFDSDKKFRVGLAQFRCTNPGIREWFDNLLESVRQNWQNELADFRNNWIEHQQGDRRRFDKCYTPEYAEYVFESVWRTITYILPALLELHFPFGMRLVEQDPNDPGPRWQQRFRFTQPQFSQSE